MSDKQKTAMQMLIKEIELVQYLSEEPSNEIDLSHTLKTLKAKATELKETAEKSQIVEAFTSGEWNNFHSTGKLATDFYTTKYSK